MIQRVQVFARSCVAGGLLLLAGCQGAPSPILGRVEWAGAQHKAVHDGDIGAKVRLDELAKRPHLYAIGPLEGLAGEITVLDGKPTICTVEQGGFRTHASLNHGAAFLVWTHESSWREQSVAATTMEELAERLPEAARAAGITAPFAFRIEGRAKSLKFHVLSPPTTLPPTFESHEKSKVHSEIAGETVSMIGFYSTEHRGVFTPGTSDVHIHFVASDGRVGGHVEDFELAPGAVVLFPGSAARNIAK